MPDTSQAESGIDFYFLEGRKIIITTTIANIAYVAFYFIIKQKKRNF